MVSLSDESISAMLRRFRAVAYEEASKCTVVTADYILVNKTSNQLYCEVRSAEVGGTQYRFMFGFMAPKFVKDAFTTEELEKAKAEVWKQVQTLVGQHFGLPVTTEKLQKLYTHAEFGYINCPETRAALNWGHISDAAES
mmetsp:Transcript_13000/g.28114  ORF Transcript_13000/g.28114 Transcript_13000/m.28114 type:complete len:140 (+) Transcript_13000:2170-2589(+)